MRRQFIFGTMLSAALTAGVVAQQPGPDRSAGSQNTRSNQTMTVTGCLQPADRTGGGQSTAGDTTSRQQGTQPAAQFILTDASVSTAGGGATGTGTTGGATAGGATGSGGAGTGSSATAGGSTRGSASGAETSYRLVAGESQDLRQYVNSRVEVTGTLQAREGASGTSGGSTATGTGATGTGAGTGTGGAGSATGSGTGSATGSATGTGATASGSTAGRPGGERGNMPTLRVTSVKQVAGSCTGGDRR